MANSREEKTPTLQRLESDGMEIAQAIHNNLETIISVGKIAYKAVKDYMDSYNDDEIKIIQAAQRAYISELKLNNLPNPQNLPIEERLPIVLRTVTEGGKVFPAEKSINNEIYLDYNLLGTENELSPEMSAIITGLITSYNSFSKAKTGNGKAIKRIYLLIISMMYAFSKQGLNNIKALDELDQHLGFLKMILTANGLGKPLLGPKDTDAIVSLSNVCLILVDQCRPILQGYRKRLSAGVLLNSLSNQVRTLCHESFKFLLHVASNKPIPPSVSLVNIAKEKMQDGGDNIVREYAYDHSSNTDDNKISLTKYMYWLGASLIDRLRKTETNSEEFRSFIQESLKEKVRRSGEGVYTPFRDAALDNWHALSHLTDKLSYLYLLINEGSTTCNGFGHYYYFVVSREASGELLKDIEITINDFSKLLKDLTDFCDKHKYRVGSSRNKPSEYTGWKQSYDDVINSDMKMLENGIAVIKKNLDALINLQKDFTNNPDAKLLEIAGHALNFSKNVLRFVNKPFKEENYRQNAISDNQSQSRPSALPDLSSDTSCVLREGCEVIVAPLLSLEPRPSIGWDYYKEDKIIDHLNNSIISELTTYKKSSLDEVKKYIQAEKELLEKANDPTSSEANCKSLFKKNYLIYITLYNNFHKRLSNDPNNQNILMLYICIELSLRQIRLLEVLLTKNKCRYDELAGAIERLELHIISEASKTITTTEVFSQFKYDLLQLASYLQKLNYFNTPNDVGRTLPQGTSGGEQNTNEQKGASHEYSRNSAPRSFSLFFEEKTERTYTTGKATILHSKKEGKAAEQPKTKEPNVCTDTTNSLIQSSSTKSIYNKGIDLALLEKDEELYLPGIRIDLYNTLKWSKPDITPLNSGWDYYWPYGKDAIDRYTRHVTHYNVLLQCFASLTDNKGANTVKFNKGSKDNLVKVTEEEVISWARSIVEQEKPYYIQYELYCSLNKMINKVDNDTVKKIKEQEVLISKLTLENAMLTVKVERVNGKFTP